MNRIFGIDEIYGYGNYEYLISEFESAIILDFQRTPKKEICDITNDLHFLSEASVIIFIIDHLGPSTWTEDKEKIFTFARETDAKIGLITDTSSLDAYLPIVYENMWDLSYDFLVTFFSWKDSAFILSGVFNKPVFSASPMVDRSNLLSEKHRLGKSKDKSLQLLPKKLRSLIEDSKPYWYISSDIWGIGKNAVLHLPILQQQAQEYNRDLFGIDHPEASDHMRSVFERHGVTLIKALPHDDWYHIPSNAEISFRLGIHGGFNRPACCSLANDKIYISTSGAYSDIFYPSLMVTPNANCSLKNKISHGMRNYHKIVTYAKKNCDNYKSKTAKEFHAFITNEVV